MNLQLCIGLICILVFYSVFSIVGRISRKKRLIKNCRRSFGMEPDVRYFDGDLENIRTYYELFRSDGIFTVDDITWNDLDLDNIFKKINAAQTVSGEQYLYNLLRTPFFEKSEFDARLEIVDKISADEDLRLWLQMRLGRLGRHRSADIFSVSEASGKARAVFYILLDLLLAGSILLTVFISFQFSILAFVILICISFVYSHSNYPFLSFNYVFKMVYTAQKLSKHPEPSLKENTQELQHALKKLRWLGKIGAIRMLPVVSNLSDIFSMLLLIDLITLELSKSRLSACIEEFITVNDYIGRVDSSISIASYRASLGHTCIPSLDFSGKNQSYLSAENMVHPLMKNPVPNSFETNTAMLLTGSNASGKSTFLKTVAVNALFSQTLCLCLADSYKAPLFRVYSSMALRDDIRSGDSYYIVEIKSIKRIIEAAKNGPPVLCIIDEVLRGTNTIERIAASTEVLLRLGQGPGLCIAATHDLELSGLLDNVFDSYHFQENIEGDQMYFDYKLYKGPSNSRNAIRLLEIMGYDNVLVQNALRRAENFSQSGIWKA